jgi:L-alanine-DL-glutamate epimerase-like enolase superfamily enzyme
MELHASLTAAVPAAKWVEYIPQLDAVAHSRLLVAGGEAVAPDAPGLGIDWRWDEIQQLRAATSDTKHG